MTIRSKVLKSAAIIIGFILVISFLGCGNDDENGGGGNGSGGAGGHVTQELNRIQRTAESHNTYTIEVSANENIAPHTLQYDGAINVTVILKGVGGNRTLRLASNGAMFRVNSNVTLILDNNITLQGHSQNTNALVLVYGGIFTMNSGSVITGNTRSSGTGGGVDVLYGSFIMNGGTISGNSGGGVCACGGTFTMNGGSITGNNGENGGGVNAYWVFTMNGGTISGNSASRGGGVYKNGYEFKMNGGTITGNTATEYGGGVYASSLTKTGGTITGYNSDSSNGNTVRDGSGVLSRRGHAVYIHSTRRKETTAGPSDNLSSSSNSGWDE